MTFLVSLRMRDSCVLVEQTTGLQILTDRYSVEKSASIQLVMKKYKLRKTSVRKIFPFAGHTCLKVRFNICVVFVSGILLAITFCFVSYMVIINVDKAGYARFLHDVLLLSVFWCHLLNCSFWFCIRLDLLTIE